MSDEKEEEPKRKKKKVRMEAIKEPRRRQRRKPMEDEGKVFQYLSQEQEWVRLRRVMGAMSRNNTHS